MHEVEIYVVCTEIGEGGIEGGFNVVGVVTSRMDSLVWFVTTASLHHLRVVPQLHRLVSDRVVDVGVANLGGDEDFGAGNARLLDSGTDGGFSAIS